MESIENKETLGKMISDIRQSVLQHTYDFSSENNELHTPPMYAIKERCIDILRELYQNKEYADIISRSEYYSMKGMIKHGYIHIFKNYLRNLGRQDLIDKISNFEKYKGYVTVPAEIRLPNPVERVEIDITVNGGE